MFYPRVSGDQVLRRNAKDKAPPTPEREQFLDENILRSPSTGSTKGFTTLEFVIPINVFA
jgi:hypothetical protein